MAITTILRGFKVSVETFDAFIRANGITETNGGPRFGFDHPDNDPTVALLYSRIVKAGGTADKKKFRLITPSRRGYALSRVAYVTYAWLCTFAHFELNLEQQLPEEILKGFEELREEILSYGKEEPLEINKIPNDGKFGLYTVFTDDPCGTYFPDELKDVKKNERKVPQLCDLCDMSFNDERDALFFKHQHRMQVHGAKDGLYPLPEL